MRRRSADGKSDAQQNPAAPPLIIFIVCSSTGLGLSLGMLPGLVIGNCRLKELMAEKSDRTGKG